MSGTTLDMALVHVETHEQFEKINGDKIAEAEALAAEALRMANEAKRAAERLAEVKKTLAMFSKKLDKVEKVVVVEEAKTKENAKPVEAEKALAPIAQPKPEAPLVTKQEDAPQKVEVEEEDEDVIPPLPPADDIFDDVVPPPPAPVVAVDKKIRVPVNTAKIAAPKVMEPVEMEQDKDFLEAILDDMGLDKACGVDEEALARIEAEELGLPAPEPKKKAVKKAAPAPKAPTEPRAIALYGDEHKDFLEKTLDSWGVDRLCGVDDVTLGFRDTPLPPPPPQEPPPPFENPTRLELKSVSTMDIVHSESLTERLAQKQREHQHAPKYYQRAPTNCDFADPFGVDHDDFVLCGKLADICEPSLDAVYQPTTHTITYAPVPHPEPEHGILKKETEEVKEEDITKAVSFREDSHRDVSLRGLDPDGTKDSCDSFMYNEEYTTTRIFTHGNLLFSTTTSTTTKLAEETRSVNVMKAKGPSQPQVVPEVPVAEGREEEEQIYKIREVKLRNKELLDAVDGHIWCV